MVVMVKTVDSGLITAATAKTAVRGRPVQVAAVRAGATPVGAAVVAAPAAAVAVRARQATHSTPMAAVVVALGDE